ncbi:hypothetical protein ACFYOT_17880 [Saccharothrix saharensis]|uniref:hypothetical protein n=1 Tax=Saccharothrix saharensis TaxID=571190 RepID=UPI0036A51525
MIESPTVVREDRAALRRVVDLALRGIRAKAHPPHAASAGAAGAQRDARWVMSSDGVIDAPAVHWEHQPTEP